VDLRTFSRITDEIDSCLASPYASSHRSRRTQRPYHSPGKQSRSDLRGRLRPRDVSCPLRHHVEPPFSSHPWIHVDDESLSRHRHATRRDTPVADAARRRSRVRETVQSPTRSNRHTLVG